MMRLITAFCLLLIVQLVHAQAGWVYLPNAPVVEHRFDDLYFVNDSTGWAVNGLGEIYMTNNRGESWTMQTDKNVYFRTLEFINDSTGFAGSLNQAVYKTTNRGLNWERIDQTFPVAVPGVCGISHFSNKMVMVGRWNMPAYVLHSIDSGKTWTHFDLSAQASSLVDCWYKSIDTVFVSGRKAVTQTAIILRSVDGGANWTEVSPEVGVPAGYAWKLDFISGSVGYASIEELAGGQTHILKTTDGGRSFELIKILDSNIDAEGIGFINEKIGFIGGWSVGMYMTTNGGINWKFVNHGKNINRFFRIREDLMYAAGASIYRFGGVVTGIEDPVDRKALLHTMELFPNPTPFKYLDVKLSLFTSTIAVIEIYDGNGRFVGKFFEKELPAGESMHRISIEKLLPGAYNILFKTNENSVRRKVVVSKS